MSAAVDSTRTDARQRTEQVASSLTAVPAALPAGGRWTGRAARLPTLIAATWHGRPVWIAVEPAGLQSI